MAVTPEQVYDMVVVQVGALAAVARTQGAALHHVKAHGALYNMAARDGPWQKPLPKLWPILIAA